jgi:endonuclease/exonuclease/phosphatase family metal-dependent hydrolase
MSTFAARRGMTYGRFCTEKFRASVIKKSLFDLARPKPYHARMVFTLRRFVPALLAGLCCLLPRAEAADTFRVATYNLENYLDAPGGSRPLKSPAARAKIREGLRALKPDVLALQEIGGAGALLELQSSLKTDGLDLPYSEFVSGSDTNIHVAVLSRLPVIARRSQTNDHFLLGGRRFRVSRGFAVVDLRVNDHYFFTLIDAHLKSKLPVPEADEADWRLEEAKILREKIDRVLATNTDANLIVLGDFNDSPNSPPLKTVLGHGNRGLVDTRPAERNGDTEPPSDRRLAARNVTWTQFYAREDLYSRMDYILLSHSLARAWIPAETYILTLPNWGQASDHRPLVATFTIQDK